MHVHENISQESFAKSVFFRLGMGMVVVFGLGFRFLTVTFLRWVGWGWGMGWLTIGKRILFTGRLIHFHIQRIRYSVCNA